MRWMRGWWHVVDADGVPSLRRRQDVLDEGMVATIDGVMVVTSKRQHDTPVVGNIAARHTAGA